MILSSIRTLSFFGIAQYVQKEEKKLNVYN